MEYKTPRKLSEEHKRKIGASQKGKEISMEQRRLLSERMKGKPSYVRTKEHRELMSKLTKGRIIPGNAGRIRNRLKGKTWEELYGKERADKHKEIMRQLRIKNNLINNPAKDPKIAAKISAAKKGISFEQRFGKEKAEELKLKVALPLEKNGRWLGGKSFEPYNKDFNNKFKRAIRNRDNHMCLKCRIHQEKLNRALTVHHIDYDKNLTIPQNCCSLCVKCNSEVNANRIHWTKFFQSLLSEKYGYKYQDNKIILELTNG